MIQFLTDYYNSLKYVYAFWLSIWIYAFERHIFDTTAVKLRVNVVVVVVLKCFDPKPGEVDFAVRVKSCRPGIGLS